ncbi:MAG: RDD family protein [Sphingomonadales bacterium]|nr:RDD family protein [Sphingomonadales bacterium]MDE2569507.1 RDD family protein [Sphingomonadales bacterium]
MASRSVPSARLASRDRQDRRRSVVTPEGVVLNLVLGHRGNRAAALLIDLFLISLAMALTTWGLAAVAQAMGVQMKDLDKAGGAFDHAIQFLVVVWIVAMFLFRNAWFLFFELGPRGATPGKRMTGLRVASRDGGRLTTEAVIARNIVRDIELFMPIVFVASSYDGGDTTLAGWAGFIWFAVFVFFPFFNRDRLRCGDIIAGTWVVEAPRHRLEQAMSLGAAAVGRSETTGAAYRFGDEELAVYGEYELQVLERVLRDDRPDSLREVAMTIAAKIGWDPGEGDERAFLEAYYTQLRARLERGMRFGQRKADKFS